ncbi:histidine kinase [Labilibacter sediminis]|nr:histidine kinase [Labilibacter sediminis]
MVMEQDSIEIENKESIQKFNQRCKNWRKLHKEDFVSIKRRVVFILLMGISFHLVVYKLIMIGVPLLWDNLLFTMFTFFLFSEGLFFFDKLLGRRYPWHLEVRKRVTLLMGVAIVWLLVLKQFMDVVEPIVLSKELVKDPEKYNLAFTIGVLYMIIYVVLIIAHNFHKSLNYFKDENEKLKQDKLMSDYKILHDQLNPHFLFNNLSTLIAIIRTDKDKAIDFAENFTDVYRYVLNSEGQAVITLKEELKFLHAYTTLHMARIGDGLCVKIDVDDESMSKKVPHLSLQILVENAIKHNITSRTRPLAIHIGINEGYLFVANNKQLKETTYSTKTGLSNLGKRLKILTDEEYRIIENESTFRVEIPLII